METLNNITIPNSQWDLQDRPIQKLLHRGINALSDLELISILVSTGTKEKTAHCVAKNVMQLCHGNLNELGKLNLQNFKSIPGIGLTKAAVVIAAIELGRRRECALAMIRPTIASGADIAGFLKIVLQDYSHEVFVVIFLNRANKIKHFEIVSQGELQALLQTLGSY